MTMLQRGICAVLALAAMSLQARDFRSSDVHPGDYPTVQAVRFMGKQLADLQKQVDCGPCQKRTCPLDHRCMKTLAPAEVLEAAEGLLQGIS